MPLELEFKTGFPKAFKVTAHAFTEWMQLWYPLRKEYPIDVWSNVEGMWENDSKAGTVARVIVQWSEDQRMTKRIVNRALESIAHEYLHHWEADNKVEIKVTDDTDPEVDMWARARVREAQREGVI